LKLFLSPGACSRAVHIALHETGLPHESERVDLRSHKTASGADFYEVNPKGYVPTLVLDDGQKLTEVAVVLQYVADRAPEKKLAPAHGTMERYRLQEALNFVSSEVHKGFSPLFNPATPDAYRTIAKDRLAKRFELLNETFSSQPYLTGEQFTVADAYLFTVLGWAPMVQIDLAPYPEVGRFLARVGERPAVKATIAAEA
jgi:glutathione S-transferase